MAKSNRGKNLKRTMKKTGTPYRGSCPLCTKTGIKLLYSHKTANNDIIKVCKNCRDK